MRRGCNEPIPAATLKTLATQKRSWTVKQALACCEDESYVPLLWHHGLKNVKPTYSKVADFLQDSTSPSSFSALSSAAYIDIDSLWPHLVGFANLVVNMRYAEAHLRDLDADPTDHIWQRKLRYTVIAVSDYLAGQAQQRKRCTTSMLRDYMQLGANQALDEIWASLEDFPAYLISPTDDEDVKLLFGFVIQLCEEEAEKRTLMRKSEAVVARIKSQLKSLRAE